MDFELVSDILKYLASDIIAAIFTIVLWFLCIWSVFYITQGSFRMFFSFFQYGSCSSDMDCAASQYCHWHIVILQSRMGFCVSEIMNA